MTEIFFSYSSKDRERVRPIRDAFAAQGFDIFWDQEVPAGVDWDTWIRQHLQQSRCAVVFWSVNSVASDNVRHEATIAKAQGKLVPVLMEKLRPDQFPMGLYNTQGAMLDTWSGDAEDAEWHKLQVQVEDRLTPLWAVRKIHEVEASLVAERARRERVESRARALEAQISKEALAQHAAELERNQSRAEADDLKAKLTGIEDARREMERRIASLQAEVASHQTELIGTRRTLSESGAYIDVVSRERDETRVELARAKKLVANTAALEKQLAEIKKDLSQKDVELFMVELMREAAQKTVTEGSLERAAADKAAADVKNQLATAQADAAGLQTELQQTRAAVKHLEAELSSARSAVSWMGGQSNDRMGLMLLGMGLIAAAGACAPHILQSWILSLSTLAQSISPTAGNSVGPLVLVGLFWLLLIISEQEDRDGAATAGLFIVIAPVALVLGARHYWPPQQWPTWANVLVATLCIAQVALGATAVTSTALRKRAATPKAS